MDFEWDEVKNARNRYKHHVDFSLAREFDWNHASIEPDLRRDYGEDRFLARGMGPDNTGYHIVFTMRNGRIRIISMRPFNRKDTRLWMGN